MKKGVWHQCGHQSQNIVADQLAVENGVGAILSVVNVSRKRAGEIASDYRKAGADILLDLQVYNPGFENANLQDYELAEARQSTGALGGLSKRDLARLSKQIQILNSEVKASAVLAPAIVYQPERQDIVAINEQLFEAGKAAADAMGLPIYATVVLGEAFSKSPELAEVALSRATTLSANGWYFSIENNTDPIPSDDDFVSLFLNSTLSLACTGLPVMSAFSGPASLLAASVGASAVGIGHWKNLWQFKSERFEIPERTGATTPAPRYFSSHLWSTIVLPDETGNIGDALWTRLQSASPFAPKSPIDGSWSLRASHNHLLSVIGTQISSRMAAASVKVIAGQAVTDLVAAARAHAVVERKLGALRDPANRHQHVWAGALTRILAQRENDFDYLDLL